MIGDVPVASEVAGAVGVNSFGDMGRLLGEQWQQDMYRVIWRNLGFQRIQVRGQPLVAAGKHACMAMLWLLHCAPCSPDSGSQATAPAALRYACCDVPLPTVPYTSLTVQGTIRELRLQTGKPAKGDFDVTASMFVRSLRIVCSSRGQS